jgi:acyl dehydratase
MTDYDGGVDIVNNDVIRLGDRFRAEKIVTSVEKKEHKTLGVTAVVTAKTSIWNQNDEIVATMKGWSFHSPKEREGKMLYDRTIYKYSEEEKKKIGNDIETYPPRRGNNPLYWEDVKVGDKLPQKVKGPLEMISIENFKHAIFGIPATYDLSYKEAVTNKYRRPSVHPLTGWPETPMNEHLDWVLCKNKGMPLPYEPGLGRSAMAYHILTDWMGDDGFVRRLETDVISPFFYGDIQWLTGEVIKKEKRKEGAAVEIALKMTNQLGELTMSGKATLLLPSSIDGVVHLPVPGNL